MSHVFTLTRLDAQVTIVTEARAWTLTVCWEAGSIWKYTLSEVSQIRNSRVAYGRVVAEDYQTAATSAAEILAQGYQLGTIEREMFDALAVATVQN
jgi:hypothetical protein